MDETKPKEIENEEEAEDDPQTLTTYVTVPPDGGWGWVIVAASFICNLVVDGIVFSFGALLKEIADEFEVSDSKATIAGSLLSGFYLIAGPFVSALANRYGFRFTGVIGGLFSGVIFALSSLAPNIEFLWVFYGILGGIGFSMIYVPAVITTGFYFEKWRALATGISVTGSGVGTIVMGPVTIALIKMFGWRGAILCQAGIIITCSMFSALYRPLKPIKVNVNFDEANAEDKTKLPLLDRIKIARDQLKKTDSTISIDNEIGITAQQPTGVNKFLKANNNVSYPTAAEALTVSTENVEQSCESLCTKENTKNKEKRRSLYSDILAKDKTSSDSHDPLKEYTADDELMSEHNHDEVFQGHKKEKKASEVRRDSITIKYRSRTTSDSSYKSSRSRRNTLSKIDAGVRPLYRDDIFFQASLNRLPQYASHASGLDYSLSVTRLPTWKDVQEEEEAKCVLCPEAVRRTLATMLDLTLLKSPTFLLFSSAGFITMMGMFVPFMFLGARAINNGYDKELAVFLVSSIGITNTIGRILCGAITSIPGVSSLWINNIALTVGGIATMFSGISHEGYFQFGFAAIFGLSISCFASLRSIMIVDLIGLENLTNAFGLLLLFQGVAATIGSPIAGMFYDLTGSYDISFYLSGALILLSGVMCYPLNHLKRWEESRKKENDKQSKKEVV